MRAWRSRFDSKYAALYYPWLRVVDPLRNAASSVTRDIPPSGHVAGQCARHRHRGWRSQSTRQRSAFLGAGCHGRDR